jgi:catalase
MEGFGIHTFRLINAEGKATFVRFHWKPVAGKASLVWDGMPRSDIAHITLCSVSGCRET